MTIVIVLCLLSWQSARDVARGQANQAPAAVGVALEGHATAGRHTVLNGDVRRYHRIAARRGTPYVDFEVEYPPLTLGAIDALDRGTLR